MQTLVQMGISKIFRRVCHCAAPDSPRFSSWVWHSSFNINCVITILGFVFSSFGGLQGAEDGYCGADAGTYVMRRFGKEADPGAIAQLASLDFATLNDMRTFFEKSGLAVQSFETKSTNSNIWAWANNIVQTGNGEVLVLAGNRRSAIKHFFVLNDYTRTGLKLLEPVTGLIVDAEHTLRQGQEEPIYIQVVFHPDFKKIFVPVRVGEFYKYMILPIATAYFLVREFRRREFLVSLCLIAVGTALVLPGCTGNEIELSPTSIDLGELQLGASIEAQFKVENRSRQEVKLSGLELGCSCLDSDFKSVSVSPNGFYKFGVTVNSTKLGAATQWGRLVVTDSEAKWEKKMEFSFEYSISDSSRLFPNPCFFGVASSNQMKSGLKTSFSIENVTRSGTLSSPRIDLPSRGLNPGVTIDIETAPLTTADQIQLLVKSDGQLGAFEESFAICFECAGEQLRFPVVIMGIVVE